MTEEMISYISLSQHDIPELVVPIRISVIESSVKKKATEPRVLIG
jgi:hypothetical protein